LIERGCVPTGPEEDLRVGWHNGEIEGVELPSGPMVSTEVESARPLQMEQDVYLVQACIKQGRRFAVEKDS